MTVDINSFQNLWLMCLWIFRTRLKEESYRKTVYTLVYRFCSEYWRTITCKQYLRYRYLGGGDDIDSQPMTIGKSTTIDFIFLKIFKPISRLSAVHCMLFLFLSDPLYKSRLLVNHNFYAILDYSRSKRLWSALRMYVFSSPVWVNDEIVLHVCLQFWYTVLITSGQWYK